VTGLVVVLVTIIAVGIGRLAWLSSTPTEIPTIPPPTEAELLQARLDLLRVRRGVDVALAAHEARREAELTKQAIAEALENGR